MPLMIDDLRAEFGRQLAAPPGITVGDQALMQRLSLDQALTHVIALAYAAGLKDGSTLLPRKSDEFDDKYAAAMEAGENPFCP